MTLTADHLDALELMDREDLIKMVKNMISGGVILNFHGKRLAQEIDKKVRPRQTRVDKKLSVGAEAEQPRNLLIEGENLQAMVTLYKERGQVDLIITDPPYNTGEFFRYNDRWDTDPNDPDLGQVVKLEDGSRHTKWMKAIVPRLNMMWAMLKPTGVLAICIDDNELFHLGMILDEIFGEENRLAIINWQKTTPKSSNSHVSVTTEYVLVYAKDASIAKTNPVGRSAKADARLQNIDNDELSLWKQGDLTGKDRSRTNDYAIQSPFTGQFHNPENRHWATKRDKMKELLEKWNVEYEDCNIGDKRGIALAIKGWGTAKTEDERETIIARSREQAEARLAQGNWPVLYWGLDGYQKPVKKQHQLTMRAGAVPVSFWVEEGEALISLDSVSWLLSESGRSRDGVDELSEIVGRSHNFKTVKPLKLFKKITQIWCPRNGLVLDPYAGSGTTGHAILELNKEQDAERRFILIEQGSPERGDKYARSLTQLRLKNAIEGLRPTPTGDFERKAEPLGGAFQFRLLTKVVDAKTVLSMRKDELIDVIITSHFENTKRGNIGLTRIEEPKYKYLVGCNEQNEGYFLIWNGNDKVGQLDIETYTTVMQEGKKAELKPPYHVYARYELYQSKNIVFWKIPEKILAHLGLNEDSDQFNEEDED